MMDIAFALIYNQDHKVWYLLINFLLLRLDWDGVRKLLTLQNQNEQQYQAFKKQNIFWNCISYERQVNQVYQLPLQSHF